MFLVLTQEGLLNQFDSTLFRNHAAIMRFALRSANRYSCHGGPLHQWEAAQVHQMMNKLSGPPIRRIASRGYGVCLLSKRNSR